MVESAFCTPTCTEKARACQAMVRVFILPAIFREDEPNKRKSGILMIFSISMVRGDKEDPLELD
eukprot:2251338-Amphidinium_carterae.1